jgi:hypothetical protein
MFAINVPGLALPRPVQSTILLLTGKKSTFIVTSGNQAAFFRPTATKDTASCTHLERMERLALKRRPAGPIGDETSTTSGHQISQRLHGRLSIILVLFMT